MISNPPSFASLFQGLDERDVWFQLTGYWVLGSCYMRLRTISCLPSPPSHLIFYLCTSLSVSLSLLHPKGLSCLIRMRYGTYTIITLHINLYLAGDAWLG